MPKEIKKFIVELEIIFEKSEKDEMPEEEYIREIINHLDKPNYLNDNESIKIKSIIETKKEDL